LASWSPSRDYQSHLSSHPVDEKGSSFSGETLKSNSRRHSKRISELMLLTEEKDKKLNPALKIASKLN
jgi:hypothetical protein